MDPIDNIVNSTLQQLQETLFEMSNALRYQQHIRALGHLTDAHLIFSAGLRSLTDILSQDEPEEVAMEIADEKLVRANQMLNGMTDIMAGYIDRAVETANISMRLLAGDQDFQQNPIVW